MTLHRLRLFISTAKHQSVTKASRELRISQPSVSQQLKLLQDHLGTVLFVKKGRGIELTDEGRAFVKEAVLILSQMDALNKNYRTSSSREPSPSLSLGASYGPSALLVPSLMTEFSSQNPAVELSLRTGKTLDIQNLVTKSEVEIAIAINPAPSPSLEMEVLREETMAIFVSARHPLAKRRTLDLAEICKVPFIVQRGRSRTEKLLTGLCGQNGKLKFLMCCDCPNPVKAAVKNGAGVGILYYDLIKEDVRRGVFKVLKIKGVSLGGSSYIIYSKDSPLSSSAKAFLDLLRAAREDASR